MRSKPLRVIYPKSFVRTIPPPAAWDNRPLVDLFGRPHPRADEEIERLERWYRELKGPKKGLKGRLRSLNRREFWGGVHELMTARIFVERGWPSRYEPRLGTNTPDFLVHRPGNVSFLAEVLTAFQEVDDDRNEAIVNRIATELDKIQHHWSVAVGVVTLPPADASLRTLIPRVGHWLDSLRPTGRSHSIKLHVAEIPITLHLTAGSEPRDSAGPIVATIDRGSAKQITSTERMRTAIVKKVKKYGGRAMPLVVFLWEGDWLEVEPFSVESALYGHLVVHLSRTGPSRVADTSRAPGGVFTWNERGRLHNRALSAVVLCARRFHEGKVHARMQLYHNPYADQPLSVSMFSGIPQSIPYDVTSTSCSRDWDCEHTSLGTVLH